VLGVIHGSSRKHFGQRAESLDFEKLITGEGLEGATEAGIYAAGVGARLLDECFSVQHVI
jgi:hypothetical protein